MWSRGCQEKGCRNEPKCKCHRRGRVKVSLFTLCRAPRKCERRSVLPVGLHHITGTVSHLIKNLPSNKLLFWPLREAEVTQIKVTCDPLGSCDTGEREFPRQLPEFSLILETRHSKVALSSELGEENMRPFTHLFPSEKISRVFTNI